MDKSIDSRSRQEGSTLILVVIFTTVLSITAASLLKFGITERRLNQSNIVFTEARNAAESMVEYGFAELKTRWKRQTSFPKNELRNNPLAIPDTAAAFFNEDSRVIYEDLELVGGIVPPGEWNFIDPSDPANTSDPQKGKLVFSRGVKVYGKATTTDPILGSKTAYCEQILSVRDAPLFSHAIFYNMDLEFHPGPKMEMTGPVHSNGKIYLQAVDRLRFHSTLMAADDIIYGFKNDNGGITQKGTVYVKDGDGDWVSFYKGSGSKTSPSSYIDSRLGEDWREDSTERWTGNVGSKEHGVPKLNPVGIDDYVPDDPSTSGDEKYNPAFAMIEPVVPTDHENYKGDEVREQQFAYKAGLVFKVEKVADASAPRGVNYKVEAYAYDRTNNKDPKSIPKMKDGAPKLRDLKLDKVEKKLSKSLVTVNLYTEDEDNDPIGGFYDGRQQQALDVIELDVGVLAELINDGEANGGNKDPWNGLYKLNPGSAVDWNGVVYVELPYDGSDSSRSDKVMPADRDVALRLVNGSEVPNPDFSKASGYDEGFTLATNGQLYVKGHFNADGDPDTGSSTETDDGKTFASDEAAVALLADSITILSADFDDSKSKKSPNERKATFNEVSAALVTGLLPGIPGGTQQSGGAHNLPRFLEKWSNIEFRYRGSLVALYESEAGHKPMTNQHSKWYSPPKRNWGYNQLFGDAIYPPGTPNTRDFRRTDFRYLTEAEHTAALTDLDGFDGSSSARGHGITNCNPDRDSNNSNGNNGNGNDDNDDDGGSNQNNGFGDGDQDAPGNSEFNNNAENADGNHDGTGDQGNGNNGNGNGNKK